MSVLSSPLTVIPAASTSTSTADSVLPGVNKRIKLSLESLKKRQLAAGDWVIARTVDAEKWVVAQAWPSTSLPLDHIDLSSAHLLALSHPSYVIISHVSSSNDSRPIKIVKSLELKEVFDGPANEEGHTNGKGKEREDAWETAILKEMLLDLSFITPSTTLIFFGRTSSSTASSTVPAPTRTFRVVNVVESATATVNAGTPSAVQGSGLAGKMEGLKLAEKRDSSASELEKDLTVWGMHWKTIVTMVEPASTGPQGIGAASHRVPANNARLKENNSALPSYINVFPPGPLVSNSESYTAYASLGGLSTQIAQVRSLLDLPLSRPEIYAKFGLKPPRGILLYGPPGTGKTHLARAIASSTSGCSCIVVNGPELSSAYHGETEERLRAVFEEAKRREPCVVVLDEVDALCPKREGGEGGEVEKRVVATLLTLMDGMANGAGAGNVDGGDESQETPKLERVVVIAATNRPNAIDPALRRPGRFDREIEIGIPNAAARLEILLILISKIPHQVTRDELSAVAAKTHGYVGADLSSLVREAGSLAIRRWFGGSSSPTHLPEGEPCLLIDDIHTSLPTIRPSAMREVFIETPTVRWSDIGGQAMVKQKLAECVEWPLLHADTFERLGVTAPRGVLLYGPPGCSKTLTAKALATESGVNFMAVKGPELLNKFVGESERAVREIFRKARAAAPAIIFFDEIDALATSRDGGDGHTGGVLTTLLNEMDGVEAQSDVIVVAATNRPDTLDSALLRPGRLDRILYVGPPDFPARKEIFSIRLRKMATESAVDVDELAVLTEGCSGAELASICQDAALMAMNEDLKAEHVLKKHFVQAARNVRRRITPDMIESYERWRDATGVQSV